MLLGLFATGRSVIVCLALSITATRGLPISHFPLQPLKYCQQVTYSDILKSHLRSSFPNSVWERTSAKLRFAYGMLLGRSRLPDGIWPVKAKRSRSACGTYLPM